MENELSMRKSGNAVEHTRANLYMLLYSDRDSLFMAESNSDVT